MPKEQNRRTHRSTDERAKKHQEQSDRERFEKSMQNQHETFGVKRQRPPRSLPQSKPRLIPSHGSYGNLTNAGAKKRSRQLAPAALSLTWPIEGAGRAKSRERDMLNSTANDSSVAHKSHSFAFNHGLLNRLGMKNVPKKWPPLGGHFSLFSLPIRDGGV
jgi:hypothetical protein